MENQINDKFPAKSPMLTVEELRAYPGNENKTDAELMEQAEFLREFSLILYAAFMKIQKNK